MNPIDTRLDAEYTRQSNGNILVYKESGLLKPGTDLTQMLYQRPSQLRNADRQLPLFTTDKKFKTVENLVLRPNFALNQITPGQQQTLKELKMEVSQNYGLRNDLNEKRINTDVSPMIQRQFQDAQLIYGNKIPLNSYVDRKLLYGFTDENIVKTPKRNDDFARYNASIFDVRNNQDSNLFIKLGGNPTDVNRKHYNDPSIYSQTLDNQRSVNNLERKSQTLYTRLTDSSIVYNDPRLLQGFIGAGVVRRDAGYSYVPENSRRN